MQRAGNPFVLSRRGVLALAGASVVPWGRLFAYSPEFWDKKDPSQWTTEEIEKLTTKSPWAKSVTAQDTGGGNGGYGQGSPGGGYPGGGGGGYPGGGGMPRIGGIGFPRGRGGGMGRGPGGGRTMTSYQGTVRWESAQPIREALKLELPEAFAGHYVISVRDIPLITDRRRPSDDTSDSSAPPQPNLDDLKQFTTLQPKGKELAQAGVVQQMTPGGTYFLFGFAKEFLQFDKKDNEIDFSTRLGRILLKTKFYLSEMRYHKQLAV
ncbi:MAG TPA: hypothetical protein VLY04_06925 [Bryobacteraceae bacterium]|nr:hypothetical protein [Bryobacteraceae bacterium]